MKPLKNISYAINKANEKHGKKWLYALSIAIVITSAAIWHFTRAADESLLSSAAISSSVRASSRPGDGDYDYTEAADHIGEKAKVSGTVLRVFTAKSGVTFFDYCEPYDDCPFSAVIFASDAEKFGDLAAYEGKSVAVTGTIKSYQGKAEMVLSSPEQIVEQ